jgi:glycerol-3-phosphate acyltransferase PlsY
MTAAAMLPFAAALLGYDWPVVVFGAIAALAVLVLHRGNIARLRAGTESRFRLRRA